MIDLKQALQRSLTACLAANEAIMQIYESEFEVQSKADSSPLTEADRRSHRFILDTLSGAFPQTHILSEEGAEIDYAKRREWDEYFLVDPLDGTKEFIKRNGEFTVNIALIRNQTPVMGVVTVPAKGSAYFAAEGIGAYKYECLDDYKCNLFEWEEIISKARKLPLDSKERPYRVVASRSHMNEDTKLFIDGLRAEKGDLELVSAGSSLKICLVAEGRADIYPRFAPTMEWDTAAGHAIAKYAGAEIIQKESGEPLVYNKENLLNPWFLVRRDSA